MGHQTNNKQKINSKKYLLTLYLSIGIVGICLLAFSAWTPFSVHTETSAKHHNQAEHQPENSQTDASDADESNPSDNEKNQPDTQTGSYSNSSTVPGTPLTQVPSPTVTPSLTPTPTSTPTPTPNPLLTNAYPEINELVEAYYAAKLSGEADEFIPLVSDISTIDTDYLHIQYGLVKDFSNFTCYTKNGNNEIAYVVYVSYDTKIVTIDTPIPILDLLTLVYSTDGSGKLLVNSATGLSPETTAYMKELATHADVQEMYTRESERFEAALDSDPELNDLYNKIKTEGAD